MVAKMQPVSDGDLRQAVLEALKQEKAVAAENIQVAAEKGVVTLTGFAKNQEEKMAAERAVKREIGVSAIANDIEVKHSYERTDTEIARDILRAFLINVCIPADRIRVTVRDGRVFLEGGVHWQFQKMMAQAAVKSLYGIKSITNSIEVRPEDFSAQPVDPAEVIVISGDVMEGGVAWDAGVV